ncbi:MAG: APC family permease [Kofleriaceae bacterium]
MSSPPKRSAFEMAFYISVCAGMAMGTSSFLIVAGAFEALSAGFVLLAIVAAMTFCVLISSPIAEMAAMFPSSPGVRTYVRQAYGDRVSLFVVFLYLLFVVVAAGAEAYMFGYVVRAIVPQIGMWVAALALIALVAGVNWLGVTPSRRTQILTTAILSLGVLAFGGGALVSGVTSASAPAAATLSTGEQLAALPTVMGICVFLFIGFEWVTPLGFGPDAYARKIPLAMPAGIGLNGLLYLVFVAGIAQVMSPAEISATPAPQLPLARKLLGDAGLGAALALCVFATTSTFNAGVMGGARLVYALARERRLPAWCAYFHAERGVPRGAIALLAALCAVSTAIIIAWDVQLAAACLASTLICTVYAALMASARKLRQTQAKRRRSFRARFGETPMLVLAILVFGLGLASIGAEPRQTLEVAAATAACGLAAVALARWSLGLSGKSGKAAPAKASPAEDSATT